MTKPIHQKTETKLLTGKKEFIVDVNELHYALMEALYLGKYAASMNIRNIARQLYERKEELGDSDSTEVSDEYRRGHMDATGFLICYCDDCSKQRISNDLEAAAFLADNLERGEFRFNNSEADE